MKAAVITPNGLELRDDVAQPKPKPNEVLVKVRTAGLNRSDLSASRGIGGHGTVGAIVGLEWSGEVVETGAEVKHVKAGDRVACSGAGGYAEYAVSDWGRVMKIPGNMDFDTAASLPVALYTMHNAIVTAGRFQAGETVLIQGASSGVGLMGLQVAKARGAKLVIGSSTNDARRAKLKDYGAGVTIDTRDEAWPDHVLKATDGKGVDLIVDMVSGALVNPGLRATRILGRIVNVGRLGGQTGDFNFDTHAMRRIDYIGVTFRTRSVEEVREISKRAQADLWDALTAGEIRLPIDRVFTFDQALEAQAYMKANQHFGKILLTM